MQEHILNTLIDYYEEMERNEGKVAELVLSKDKTPDYFVDANFRFRTQFNRVAQLLESREFVKISWQKPYQVQKIEKLTLNQKNLAPIYRYLNRTPKIKNKDLLIQTLVPFEEDQTLPGEIAKDLVRKIEQEKPLLHCIKIASIQEVHEAFYALKALSENKEPITIHQFSKKIFNDEHAFSSIEYILKPLLLNYGVVKLNEESNYLATFHIAEVDSYVHLKGCGCFKVDEMLIDLSKWPSDFVINTKALESVKWVSQDMCKIVVANSLSDFAECETQEALVIYCADFDCSVKWIQTYFPMFFEAQLPLVRLASSC
ncbi:MAG TPA: hypothetical protein DCY20_05690 [Firmicutes bacterium]|nr:hypothetical protein [Bacillota bacterium]